MFNVGMLYKYDSQSNKQRIEWFIYSFDTYGISSIYYSFLSHSSQPKCQFLLCFFHPIQSSFKFLIHSLFRLFYCLFQSQINCFFRFNLWICNGLHFLIDDFLGVFHDLLFGAIDFIPVSMLNFTNGNFKLIALSQDFEFD